MAVAIIYIVFVVFCLAFEGYTRRRFGIQPKREITAVADRADRLKAERGRTDAEMERERWLPYELFQSVVMGCAIIAMVATGAALSKRLWPTVRAHPLAAIKLYVLAVVLPALLVCLAILLPAELSDEYYESLPAAPISPE